MPKLPSWMSVSTSPRRSSISLSSSAGLFGRSWASPAASVRDMFSDEADTSGTAPRTGEAVAGDADALAGAGAGGAVAAADPLAPLAGAGDRGAGGRAAVA